MTMVSFTKKMLEYDAANAHVSNIDVCERDVIAGDDDEIEDDDDGADGGECLAKV